MATQTRKGTKIALRIHRLTKRELTEQLEQTCSLIGRHAATYCRYQEGWCSDPWFDRHAEEMERKEIRLMLRIVELAADIDCEVTFSGDPRGHTVRLWPLDSPYFGCDKEQSRDFVGADIE